MTNVHRNASPWEWRLAAGTATRLAAAPRARWLRVTEGRAWLTQSGAGPTGDDVWLDAGERQRLPAGTEWVVEGWPQARIELLEAPAAEPAPQPAAISAGPGRAVRWRVWPPALRAA